jgi:hypothetical protein
VIPKFQNTLAWEQAQCLMQPAYIRLVDNIRKQLEDSSWKATYEEVQEPIPGYYLCLSHQDRTVRVNLWDVCFEICFQNIAPTHTPEKTDMEQVVEIDTSLFEETGEVDWQRLDNKTRGIVAQIFAKLPAVE